MRSQPVTTLSLFLALAALGCGCDGPCSIPLDDKCQGCVQPSSGDYTCKSCKGGYDPATQCKSCPEGWVEAQGKCYAEHDPCAAAVEGSCEGCRSDDSGNYTCSHCRNGFDPFTKCKSCFQGTRLVDGRCVYYQDPCSNIKSKNCLGCVSTSEDDFTCIDCLYGFDPSTGCKTCLPGTELQGNACVDTTPDPCIYALLDGACETCTAISDDDYTCETCRYGLDPATRCQYCPVGFVDVEGVCRAVNDPCISALAGNCSQCVATSDTEYICRFCKRGYTSSSNCESCPEYSVQKEGQCLHPDSLCEWALARNCATCWLNSISVYSCQTCKNGFDPATECEKCFVGQVAVAGKCVDEAAWLKYMDTPRWNYWYSQTKPRFSIANLVLVDRWTDVEWQRRDAPELKTWEEAEDYCEQQAGGWRLPTRMELVALFSYLDEEMSLRLEDVFHFGAGPYWTATKASFLGADRVWTVGGQSFPHRAQVQSGSSSLAVRCARWSGEEPPSTPRFEVQKEGAVVRDRVTGLYWLAVPHTGADCASPIADIWGWRLPDMAEVATLVDSSRAAPALEVGAFPHWQEYWRLEEVDKDPPAGHHTNYVFHPSTGQVLSAPELSEVVEIHCVR